MSKKDITPPLDALNLDSATSEEKQEALRQIIELIDPALTRQVLALGMDRQEEDLVRIEAWRALGMAEASPILSTIREAAGQLVRNSDEDEDVQIQTLLTLALLPVTENEIQLAQDVIESDAYILLQSAAFDVIKANKHSPQAVLALESLQTHPDFGTSARWELQSESGRDNP
ncbi:hypothetical protein PAECIP112173_04537 [Paenibacillus sp. JJ-100]|uniref:hypothetical protein n=1 Tax=Paenibacillus sp. JJ-100 TaxID=2974896 RepID=UPI0022FF78A8|nr:hypothetical protein [Paenibacillus sp. JJ-100]CAI6085151.1 hypothetical protein PAECIP112173_04537 [Paenibacillus sp. JJ-100]